MTNNFSIIIPNNNGSKFLFDCLYSLYSSIKITSANFEIIIIDNNSIDDSLSIAKDFFQKYRSTKLSTQIISLSKNTIISSRERVLPFITLSSTKRSF